MVQQKPETLLATALLLEIVVLSLMLIHAGGLSNNGGALRTSLTFEERNMQTPKHAGHSVGYDHPLPIPHHRRSTPRTPVARCVGGVRCWSA